MSGQSEICVVHLARAANGIEPFRAFLDSYRQHRGGVEHDLAVVFKGFGSDEATQEHRALAAQAADGPVRFLSISDAGLDIEAYRAAARALDHRYLCFLNSFSTFRDGGWLVALRAAHRPGVGAVGATGSYQSLASTPAGGASLSATGRVRERLRAAHYRRVFGPFPNHHLRTNALLIEGSLFRALRIPLVRRKLDALRFESGREGMTPQLVRMGLRVLVVGRDGRAYGREAWPESDTFWQGDQENLLVEDNRTRIYAASDAAQRQRLSALAWGPLARPLGTDAAARCVAAPHAMREPSR